MIEESITFLDKFSKEFNPTNDTPSAVGGLIALFKQETTHALLGKTNCVKVVIKLKGAQKTYRALNGASWSSMSGWKVQSRGYGGGGFSGAGSKVPGGRRMLINVLLA